MLGKCFDLLENETSYKQILLLTLFLSRRIVAFTTDAYYNIPCIVHCPTIQNETTLQFNDQ